MKTVQIIITRLPKSPGNIMANSMGKVLTNKKGGGQIKLLPKLFASISLKIKLLSPLLFLEYDSAILWEIFVRIRNQLGMFIFNQIQCLVLIIHSSIMLFSLLVFQKTRLGMKFLVPIFLCLSKVFPPRWTWLLK